MSSLDLGIVVVSWNVCDLLRRCLQSVEVSLAGSSIAYRIVVVDNASSDGTIAMVRSEFPAVLLVANRTNRGFTGGNNDGIRALGLLCSTGSGENAPRYVMLLNPDTEVVDDALPRLLRYLDNHPDAFAAGPALRYGDGSPQSSRRRFPTIGTLFWESTLLEQWWPHNPWAMRYRCEERPAVGVQVVDWVVGAAVMVRAAPIQRAGGLDEGFFMYSEELEWQERIARCLGSPAHVVYLADAVIVHHEGRSSEQNLVHRQITFHRSRLRYARLRFGPRVALAVRAFLLLTYVIQILVEVGKWILGHKRPLRAERVRQYLRIVASGL